MRLRGALLAATVLAMPIAASAQPVTGLYVGAGAGVNFSQQENVKGLFFPDARLGVDRTGNLKSSWGFAGVLSLGWGFGNGLRAEIEGNYRYNHIGGFNGVSGFAGGTQEQKFGGMVNALYDFNGISPWFVPYVGAGIGYLGIEEKWKTYNTATVAGIGAGGIGATGSSTQGAFAYQAIIGAAFPLPQVMPGLAATLEYRFLGTAGDRSYSGTAFASGIGATPVSVKLGPDYNHSIMVGLRYNFGVAPPPPPPPAAVPAQAPAKSYLVFFDWDKADSDRPCAPDHQGSGGQLNAGAVHADRGEWLHRYLGHTAVQHGPVDPPCERGEGRADQRRRAGECHHDRRASAKRICWFRRARACASRRTGVSRSSSADAGLDDSGQGAPQGAPFCLTAGSLLLVRIAVLALLTCALGVAGCTPKPESRSAR